MKRGEERAARMRATFSDRFWARVNIGSGCWEWTGRKIKSGYGSVSAKCLHIGPADWLAHRMAWYLTTGQHLESGQCLMHSCDNPGCVNPSHLSVGTQSENIADMVAKGRSRLNRLIPLDHSVRASIADDRANGVPVSVVANRYDIHPSTVSKIVRKHRATRA